MINEEIKAIRGLMLRYQDCIFSATAYVLNEKDNLVNLSLPIDPLNKKEQMVCRDIIQKDSGAIELELNEVPYDAELTGYSYSLDEEKDVFYDFFSIVIKNNLRMR